MDDGWMLMGIATLLLLTWSLSLHFVVIFKFVVCPLSLFSFGLLVKMRSDICSVSVILWLKMLLQYAKKCKYFMTTRGIRIHRLQFLILNLKSWSENSHFSQIVFLQQHEENVFIYSQGFFFLWFTRLIAPNSFAS